MRNAIKRPSSSSISSSSFRFINLFIFGFLLISVSSWEWVDYMGGTGGDIGDGSGSISGDDGIASSFRSNALTLVEIQDMRVRDIKRRLTRTHGYTADEVGRMLDKKELIEALSFEEEKDRKKVNDRLKRFLAIRGIIVAVLAVFVVVGWPVWVHLYEVASVNFVVYTDKKWHEAKRCIELSCITGMIGVLLMAILDVLQVWLTTSVLLSWVMTSKYFFPVPSLPFRPAQFMGEKVANGPLAKYGMNVGPMAVTWTLRFTHARLEYLTGRALSYAYQQKKKKVRAEESAQEKAARKAARKAAKRAAREEAEMQRRKEQEAESIRRKEAADHATAHLFGAAAVVSDTTKNPDNGDGDDDGADGQHGKPGRTEGHSNNEARREFQEQMDNFDLNDLD